MSLVFIISAPSGSGKSTLVNRLLREDPNLLFSISYTTRKPRGLEQDGQHYHFVSRETFEESIRQGDLLEWAEVFGNYYGTHRQILTAGQKNGQDVVLDIDVQGARQLKSRIPDAVSVFILPPSREELEARLRQRSEDSDETIRKRLSGAEAEIRQYGNYDYVVVNDNLEVAYRHLKSVVEAERAKKGPAVDEKVQRILATFAKERA